MAQLVKLNHQNVLRHYGVEQKRWIVVTEFMETRVTLPDGSNEVVHNARQLIDALETALSWHCRISIATQVIAGLRYLHDNYVVHCDLKAANVFVQNDAYGNFLAKLGDFGMAQFEIVQFSRTQSSTQSNEVTRGTIAYMAPELLETGAKHDQRTDVYSFAMFLVELTLPERSHPWEGKIASSDLIFKFLKEGKRPDLYQGDIHILNEESRKTWIDLIKTCWTQERMFRPNASHIHTLMCSVSDVTRSNVDFPSSVNVHLDVHQGSAVEELGRLTATIIQEEGRVNRDVEDDICYISRTI